MIMNEEVMGRHHSEMDQPEHQESGEVRIVDGKFVFV